MKPATTVRKICRILGEFKQRPSLGVSDLARQLDMLPSDVYRVLVSLQTYGYIQQDPETRRYQVVRGLLRLGLTTFQRNVLQEKGRTILTRLSGTLDAATHLAMLDIGECEVFLVDQVAAPDGATLFEARPGATTAAHSTASGKTIMAGMDAETSHRAVQRWGLQKATGKTINSLAPLQRQLETIRTRELGYDPGALRQGRRTG